MTQHPAQLSYNIRLKLPAHVHLQHLHHTMVNDIFVKEPLSHSGSMITWQLTLPSLYSQTCCYKPQKNLPKSFHMLAERPTIKIKMSFRYTMQICLGSPLSTSSMTLSNVTGALVRPMGCSKCLPANSIGQLPLEKSKVLNHVASARVSNVSSTH
ncbi:hypothetical protein XENOCAPTIV_000581 [Xenoophorus captivus]|uniref:Uncharacterized protein n=1 Tax=Xenoophorus captivus TaxID=1517983 RepID=A0ABV0REN5_9TELE